MSDIRVSKNVIYGDILSNALSFLGWKELIRLRQVASSWKLAIEDTSVEEQVHVKTQRVLHLLAQGIPKLRSLKLDQSALDILQEHEDNQQLLYSFSNLSHFECLHTTPSLLQPYDFQALMSQWQNLQSLNLHGNEDLEWKLSDLATLKHLNDLRCINNSCLEGDTQDLLLQSDDSKPTNIFYNLVILDISGCAQVTGKLSDFCRLPKLQWLGINRTLVTGDLRHDVLPGYFPSLQGIGLCRAVYGADQIQLVQDAPAVMKARLQIVKQSTWESPLFPLMVHLSPDSPDYHERIEQRLYSSERDPPFGIEIVEVGKRWGWRWSNYLGGYCDTHWVDPEPDCDTYRQEMEDFEPKQSLFAGFLDPPTPAQYLVLCQERCL